MLEHEMISLKQLIEGNRPPANGMEIHFRRCLKGDASPCSEKEKEWYQFWVNSKVKESKESSEVGALIKYVETQESLHRKINHPRTALKVDLRKDYRIRGSNSNVLKDNSRGLEQRAQMNNELRAIEQRNLIDKSPCVGESAQKSIEKTGKATGNVLPDQSEKGGFDICPKCGGGGANGGCTECDGTGWVNGRKKSSGDNYKWGSNDGFGGTREENKKMRGQLWGDMRNRGRGR